MTLKKPSELFEQRRLESLAEESAKKEKSQVKNKRIISPKELFGEVVEVEEPSVVEEVVEIKVEDTAKEDLTGFVEEKIGKQTEEIQERLKEKFEEYSEQFEDRTKKNYQNLSNQFNSVKENLIKKVSNLEVDILRNEKHLRNNNVDVDEIRQDINETIQKIKSEIIEDVGVLQEPPSNVTSDPLTPLDQNFVTLDQLQEHYRLFINRIQQQLTTLGGGGETRLEFLDDVNRNSAKIDGKFLKYDAVSGKWVGASSGGTALTVKESIGNGGTENLSVDNVNTIIFDNSTGFNVTDNGDGEVFVNLGSSFATWYIDGSDDLHATGEDAVEFVAGPGIAISTKSTSTGIGTGLSKSITITSIGSSQTLNTTLGFGNTSTLGMSVGVVTATKYYGDGSSLSGIVASGTGIVIKDDGVLVGTASTIDFGTNLSVTFESGIATVSATSSGIATYSSNAGIATYASIAGYSTSSGIATYSGTSGIATYSGTSGIATYSGTSGIATYSGTSGIATYSGTSGIATYATTAGIATYSGTSGIATYSGTSGIATYATTAGIATYSSNAGYSTSSGIATYASIAGYSTSSGIATYSSNAGYSTSSGIATYSSNAGIATYASIAGYSTSSGIATYSGTSGIATYSSIAGISTYSGTSGIATYATNAGVSTYATSAGIATTATNLSDAANITTGTINKDRLLNSNSFNVLGDLYVSNNISFGGTTTQLNTQQLQIVDADIVLGIGTSFSPTDNTANHGGIAIASTEGTPLVDLNIVPGETNPSTYKKIMWFKGDTIGAGLTDAWLFNYGVGIGSTQVPNGVRLAVGKVQVTDTAVTATTFSGNATSATYATNAGISTYSSTAGIATYSSTAGIATYSSTAGIATYATNAGIATYSGTSGISTYATNAGIATYSGTSGISTYATNAGISTYATISGYSTSSGIATYAINAGVSTYAISSGIATYSTSSGIATYATTAGVATYATTSGIATYATTAGVATYATTSGIATYSTSSGISTYATTSGIATYSTSSGISTYATTSGISTYAINAGVSTYATSSGIATVAQGLSGTPNIIVGIVTATKYYGDGSSLTGISAGGITSTTSINTTGIITANSYYVGSTQVINSAGQWVGSGLSVYSNIDAGVSNSIYGGIPVIDGGVP